MAEPVTAVWLQRVGEFAQVLVEIGAEWRLVIRERADGNYSHIAEIRPDDLPPMRGIDKTGSTGDLPCCEEAHGRIRLREKLDVVSGADECTYSGPVLPAGDSSSGDVEVYAIRYCPWCGRKL